MASPKLPEDRAVLTAKFENVNALLRAYGDGVARVESKLHTLLILRPDVTAELVAGVVKDAMVPLAEAGVDRSLIDQDLEDARSGLGEEFRSWFTQCWQFMVRAQQKLAAGGAGQGQPAAALANVFDFVFASIMFIKMSTLPAQNVRARLIDLLDRRPRERVETLGRQQRRARDDRIRHLSQAHKTTSPARVLALARGDPVISGLRRAGVTVTEDVVRNVLHPRKGRRRRPPARSKNTGQAKD